MWLSPPTLNPNSSPLLAQQIFLVVCTPLENFLATPLTLTGPSTLTNAFRSNQNNSEFPFVADRREKNISTNSRLRKTMIQFFSKIFCMVYVKAYQFNTYRKLSRVRSIVSRMVHYPAALLVINIDMSNIYSKQ